MAQTNTQLYAAIANLNLWVKLQAGTSLVLADVNTLIPNRWTYIRDNWQTLKIPIQANVSSYNNPDFLNQQIIDFSDFVAIQVTSNMMNNPFNDINNFYKFYAIFDNILVNSVQISDEDQAIVDIKTRAVQNYSKNDFLNIKSIITKARDTLSDYIGLTDPSYNAAYNRNPIPPNVDPSIVELNRVQSYQSSINSVDFILANLFQVEATVDRFAIARANANNPAVNIGQYSSGYLVKFDYGNSLEDVAQMYLGDRNLWLDIAIANGLKAPYIDEIGQRLLLLSNGNGNQINISSVDINGNLNINKFFINQAIILQSNTQVFADQRTITNIKVVPVNGEIVLELDGSANLGNYKISENANVRVFLPNTINSNFLILIPSSDALPNSRVEEVPWFLAKAAEDEKNAKIDLAIGPNGDLIFDSTADLTLSYGLNNAVQAIKLKLQTEKGTLRQHLDYGLLNLVGSKNTNAIEIQRLLTDSIVQQIGADSRFERVNSINVAPIAGASGFTISMSVKLAGGSTVIPISFTVSI
jgi:hypothetical protein